MQAIEWRDGDIVVIDQTELPHRVEYRTLKTTAEIAEAITALRVRGAPALGIIGAMGVAQAAVRTISMDPRVVLAKVERTADELAATRPTAVNLRWAIDRLLRKARALATMAAAARLQQALVEEALAIQREDEQACLSMARNAQAFIPDEGVVMTHCNTGLLCTGGYGTALGAIRLAHEEGRRIVVLATETRPLLQGARLTAWELSRLDIPHALIVDGAAPGLIARGEVSMVVVGADRIAANGDVANKVGTYGLALAAAAAGIPFVVVAPTSTIDPRTPDGAGIDIEERAPSEVTTILGSLQVAPRASGALNPAFDVTPAALITAIVTERGVAHAPYGPAIEAMLGGRAVNAPKRAKRAAAKRPSAKKVATASRASTRGGGRGAKTPAPKARAGTKGSEATTNAAAKRPSAKRVAQKATSKSRTTKAAGATKASSATKATGSGKKRASRARAPR